MQKLFALVIVVLSGTFTSMSFAQPFDTTGANTNDNPTPSTIMTTEQFKKAADKLSKQTSDTLSKQVEQQMSNKETGPKSSSTYAAPTQPAPSTTPTETAAQPNQASQATPPTEPSASTTRSPAPAQPAKNQGSSPPSQIYTGFGGGQPAQNSNTTGNNQDKANSNWNVGY